MTIHITRREALKVAIAGALAPLALNLSMPLECEFVAAEEYVPDPYGSPTDWHPSTAARVIAAWELGAQQHNRPAKWRSLKYDGALQWSDGRDGRAPLIAWYGIGPANWTAERMADLAAWLEDRHVLSQERIARGRAYAIISVGRLSKRLRHELAKPAWKRDRSIVV
ncbi:MAG TPA: hypothetical protein VGN12_13955 [Pirellulales bacterium]|jgi:hypothetical protein